LLRFYRNTFAPKRGRQLSGLKTIMAAVRMAIFLHDKDMTEK
jgi:hypothetical protein